MAKTYRDVLRNEGGNLFWCKPVALEYGGKIAIIAQNEGDIAGLQIDGEDIQAGDLFDALVRHFGIDEAENLQDLYNYMFDDGDVKATDMDCRNCPWFGTCEAMDSEVV